MALDWDVVKREKHRLTFNNLDANKSGKILREDLVDFMENMSRFLAEDVNVIEVF